MDKNSLGCSSSFFWIGVQAEPDVQWNLSLSFGEDQAWARLRDTQGVGNGLVACDYEANEGETTRFMTITLVSADGHRSASYLISQVASLPPGALPGWMELPESRQEYTFATYNFKYGYYTYRNYSVGWSAQNHLAVWVAYPLNGFYRNGNAGYTGTWSYDETGQVSTSSQPCLFKGYYGNDIDRGHQLPSADRQCCEEANNQTFFFTNMTPQRDSFNTGVWVSLENRVRSYSSKCDTLYVVTGAIVGDSPKYAHDNNGVPCPIPSHYYKALLAYKKSSSFGISGWRAIGFWLDHTTSSQTMVSIRDLESKVGFDLFPNLKSAVGESLYDTIEKEKSSTFWN